VRRTPSSHAVAAPPSNRTLFGVGAPPVPPPPLGNRPPVPPPPIAGPPPGLSGARRTAGFNIPPPHLGGGTVPPPPPPPPPGFSSEQPEMPSAFGTASFAPPVGVPRTSARGGLYAVLALLALAVIGGTGYWYYWTVNKPGKIQLVTVPADATVLIDNAKVG